jgi:hypothetical protein
MIMKVPDTQFTTNYLVEKKRKKYVEDDPFSFGPSFSFWK